MRDLVVIGAGGFGRETLDVIEAINRAAGEAVHRVVGVVDDAPSPVNCDRLAQRGHRLLGTIDEWLASGRGEGCVIAVGDPAVRRRIAGRLSGVGFVAGLVHPSAVVGSCFLAGPGSVVCGGVQISTNVELGDHVHLNPGAIIGHDARLADLVSVNPGAIVSGEVTVEREVLIGAGAVVLQGLKVGRGSTVGAAACVVRDVEPGVTVKGVPAR